MNVSANSCRRPYAYQLRYAWSAWTREACPVDLLDTAPFQAKLATAWEADGFRPLEWNATPGQIQILFSARPDLRPELLATRAKGRLQHALRQEQRTSAFRRHFGLVSVGAPNSDDVDAYLRDQLQHGEFADPRYRDALAELAYTDPDVHLQAPLPSKSGRYVLAFHYVFVVADRWRMPQSTAVRIRNGFLKASSGAEWKIAKLSMMPDHVHVAVRGAINRSPLEIGEEMREATCAEAGTHGFWMSTGYVGSFGSYGMGAVRAKRRERSGG